jgi:hypothetical protein
VDNLEKTLSGELPFDQDKLLLLNLEIMIAQICQKKTNSLQQLKLKAIELTNKMVLLSNFTNNSTIITGDSMVSSHIYHSSSEVQSQEAVDNGFPIYNLTACEAILRHYYNFTEDIGLLYMSNSYDSSLNDNGVNSYQISVYESSSKHKLDISICKNITQNIYLPISNITGLNMTQYREMKAQGVDIFNPKDPYYTDRCITVSDNSTDGDTTVNMRRQNAAKQLPQCYGFNCTYLGIDDNNYIECQCTGIDTGVEIFNRSINFIMDSFSQFNIDIITCYFVIGVNIY